MVRHARRRMLAVLHAGRGQHGPRDDLAAVAERQVLVSRVDGHPGHFERHEQLRAKPLRLRHGAPRQFAAADAGWETRDSFRSGNCCPPARPARADRAAASADLPMRRTPPLRGRRDRRRQSRGRTDRARPTSDRPRRSATCRGSGLRSTDPSSKNSAGSSLAPIPAASSRLCVSGFRATSSQR